MEGNGQWPHSADSTAIERDWFLLSVPTNQRQITLENLGPVFFSCTAALVQLVRVKESMFVSFQLIALVQQCS